jgi:signal transduction histidine kinase
VLLIVVSTLPLALLTGVLLARMVTDQRQANERRLLQLARAQSMILDRGSWMRPYAPGARTIGASCNRHLRVAQEAQAAAESSQQAAEAAARAKDEFLAMLGHELRNPLSPIVTALHLLRLRGEGKDREHGIIARQVQHLTRLVEDLDVSRIARGLIELGREPVDVREAIGQALEMSGPLFEERQHQLEVAVPGGCVVIGDRARLAQVFANVLVNAAKYTPPGGRVSVRAGLEGEDNEDAAVMLTMLLRQQGHDVRMAFDGPGAFDVAASFRPGVVILDIGLPVVDGYEVAGRLRAVLHPHTPAFIAVTGYGQQHDRVRSSEAGFAAHFVKPLDFAQLTDVLASLAVREEPS